MNRDVWCASDRWEALYALRNGPRPCLILLDLNMGGMDGWEFRRRQLLWPQMASIPILVVSGHPEVKAVMRAMQAAEVWQKPVAVDRLLRAVGDHCRSLNARRVPASSSRTRPHSGGRGVGPSGPRRGRPRHVGMRCVAEARRAGDATRRSEPALRRSLTGCTFRSPSSVPTRA
jgi:CheY-like chemotaxis protein